MKSAQSTLPRTAACLSTPLFLTGSRDSTPENTQRSDRVRSSSSPDAHPNKRRRVLSGLVIDERKESKSESGDGYGTSDKARKEDQSESDDESDANEDKESIYLEQYRRSFHQSARRNAADAAVRRFFDLEAAVDGTDDVADEESENDRDFVDDSDAFSGAPQSFFYGPANLGQDANSLENDLQGLNERAARYRQQVRTERRMEYGYLDGMDDDNELEAAFVEKELPVKIDAPAVGPEASTSTAVTLCVPGTSLSARYTPMLESVLKERSVQNDGHAKKLFDTANFGNFRVASIEDFDGTAPQAERLVPPKSTVTQNLDHHNARALAAYRAANHSPPKRSTLPFWLELPATEAKHTLEKGQWVRVGWGKYKGRLAFVINTNAIYLPGRKPPIFHLRKPRHTVQLLKPPTSDEQHSAKYFPHQALLQIATHEEFAPFANSHHVELRRLVGTALSPPLRPGDRVVVTSGPYRGQSGYVAGIHITRTSATSKNVARVIPSYRGAYDPDIAEHGIFPEMMDLERHLLDFSYVLSVGDRVRFVDCDVEGVEGRIVKVDAENEVVYFENQNGALYDACTVDQVTRIWQEGDFVRVRTGEHKGRSGSVMTVNSRKGLVEVFDLNRLELKRPSRQWQDGRLFWVQACAVDFNAVGDTVTFGLPAAAQKISPLLLPGSVEERVSYATLFASPGTKHALRPTQIPTTDDISEQVYADVARHYIGLNVSFVAKGPLKGFRGTVVGVYNSTARESRLRSVEDVQRQKLNEYAQSYYPSITINDSRLNKFRVQGRNALVQAENDHGGLLLTLRRTGGLDVVQDVAIENVVHYWTMVPLLETRNMAVEVLRGHQHLVTAEQKHAAFPPQSPPPRPCTPCPSPSSGGFESSPQLEGETNGEWLCLPGLAQKRLDVFVQGVGNEPQLSAKVREMEGRGGYLLLNAEIAARETNKKFSRPRKADKVDVYGLTVGGTKHPIDRRYLRPSRTGRDGRTVTEMVHRVVVIGGDVQGDLSNRGCYGETDPFVTHSHGPNTVAVRFSLEQYQFFHASSLCLSENVRITAPHGIFDTFHLK
ncbi:hypothetical protein R3P38DRAFT_3182458 [Favolaschia claudopus]|uniref:KOW domain-containing protein n=1 Tax=Favolaschia claudopus TaxID=2862362 RepID=A0AAW0CJL6_9AGAR